MRVFLPAVAGILLCPDAVQAQRTDDNAVREAQDGFGFTAGDEEIGIYNIEDARGFSPLAAGNVRMDDLYIDIRGDFPDAIKQGSTVKVGITAIRTPLLAPSGVGEIQLKALGPKPVASLGAAVNSWGSVSLDGEMRIGMRDGFSLVAAGSADPKGEAGNGEDWRSWHFGVVPRWQFAPDGFVKGYVGYSKFDGSEYGPHYYTTGAFSPQRLPRRVKLQQPWNRNGNRSFQAGAMGELGLGGSWRARAGLFRSRSTDTAGVFEFADEVDQAGFGVRRAILSERYDVDAWSGEAQLIRSVSGGGFRGELMAAVRFRRVSERSGAGQLFTLDSGPVRLDDAPQVPKPVRVSGPRDFSRISQVQPGLSARLSWRDRVAVNLGVQRADYRKSLRFAAGGATSVTSRPLVWNAGLAVSPTTELTLYAGMARGLEESGVAPDIAANARTALNAAITRQKDVGIAWNPDKKLSVIAGAFEIRRPYANVDANNVFRFVGALRNKGVELSVVARPIEGLSLVAGALRQWPRLSGDEVSAGIIGRRPAAYADYSVNGAIDYAIPGVKGLSANAALKVVGPREAKPDGSYRLPRREVVGFGLRYGFRKAGTDWAVNLNVDNLLNSYEWFASSDGGTGYTDPRAIRLSLFVDL